MNILESLFMPNVGVIPLIAWGALALAGTLGIGYFATKETESSALDDVKNTTSNLSTIAVVSTLAFALYIYAKVKRKI